MHTAWLAVLCIFAIIDALSLTGVALVAADLACEVHRARKRPARLPARRPVTDEEIEAALREWAGEAL